MVPLLVSFCLASPIFNMTPADIDAYLDSLGRMELTLSERLHYIALDSLGTPYADGPLGEGPGATVDSDPLIDLSRVDCLTFIEQVVALATSKNHEETIDHLRCIRYHKGRVSFQNRNHFTIADWIHHNPWCEEITAKMRVPTAEVTRTIDRRAFLEKHGVTEIPAKFRPQEITLRYIPVSEARKAEKRFPRAAFIAFIGADVDWLFTLHTGLYLKDETGGQLFHASSKEGQVVAVPFAPYLESNKDRYLGFTVYRIVAPDYMYCGMSLEESGGAAARGESKPAE